MRPARRRSSVPFFGATTGGLRAGTPPAPVRRAGRELRPRPPGGRCAGAASRSRRRRRRRVPAWRSARGFAPLAGPAARGHRLRRLAAAARASFLGLVLDLFGRRARRGGGGGGGLLRRAVHRPRACRGSPVRRRGVLPPPQPSWLPARGGGLPRPRTGSRSSPAPGVRPRASRRRAAVPAPRAGGRPVRSRSERGRPRAPDVRAGSAGAALARHRQAAAAARRPRLKGCVRPAACASCALPPARPLTGRG